MGTRLDPLTQVGVARAQFTEDLDDVLPDFSSKSAVTQNDEHQLRLCLFSALRANFNPRDMEKDENGVDTDESNGFIKVIRDNYGDEQLYKAGPPKQSAYQTVEEYNDAAIEWANHHGCRLAVAKALSLLLPPTLVRKHIYLDDNRTKRNVKAYDLHGMLADLKLQAVKSGHTDAAALMTEINQPFRTWGKGLGDYFSEQQRLEDEAERLSVASTWGVRVFRTIAQVRRRAPQDDSYAELLKQLKKWEDRNSIGSRNSQAVYDDLCAHLLKHDTDRRLADGYDVSNDVEDDEEAALSAGTDEVFERVEQAHALIGEVSAENESLKAENVQLKDELDALRQDDVSSMSGTSLLGRISALEARTSNDSAGGRRRERNPRENPFRPRTLNATQQPCPRYRSLGIQKKCLCSTPGGVCDATATFTGRRPGIVTAAITYRDSGASA